MKYAVFTPIFTPLPYKTDRGGNQYAVEMVVTRGLKAAGATAALAEAKALGFKAPVVGQLEN